MPSIKSTANTMRSWTRAVHVFLFLLLCGIILGTTSLLQAQAGDKKGEKQPPLPGHWIIPPSPALSPAEQLETFEVQPGFVVELFASEPMVQDPVAMTFDERGRLWVVEMKGYMPDIDGLGENLPVGRISVLRDHDGDGTADEARVFLDKLVLPRAVARVQDGILYAADGQLWYCRETEADGAAATPVLVDAQYVTSGNVEHQPNGLLVSLDNWIYSAKSKFRYRYKNGRWVKEETEFRGQWGISQDDFGRLYYNFNYSQLHADIVPPNVMSRNPQHKSASGISTLLTTNQSVFPIRPNTGVNRGYRPGILDDRGRLLAFASACAPEVYRGDHFPAEFSGNAFVCGPGANIIKRNVVFEAPDSPRLTAAFAYPDVEFMASRDERFRPVYLKTGPEGALYVVDLYRGIIQHHQYMTSHLRREILSRQLDKPIHRGRIWRIRAVRNDGSPSPARLDLSGASMEKLLKTLAHPNGFWRDTAQRLLVERAAPPSRRPLIHMALRHENPLARIHAMWTLEGIGLPDPRPLEHALHDRDPKVQIAALRVMGSLTRQNAEHLDWWMTALHRLADQPLPLEVALHAALALGDGSGPETLLSLQRLLMQHSEWPLFSDAVLSGLTDRGMEFLNLVLSETSWDQSSPGRATFLSALVSAIYKQGEPKSLLHLLDVISQDAERSQWRSVSMLEGLAQNARGRQPTPVALPHPPSALIAFMSSHEEVATKFDGPIKALFSWPGHTPARNTMAPMPSLTLAERRRFANGGKSFLIVCAGCHGVSGEGLSPLAPPLVNSSWVVGPPSRLIRILLQGLEGPIHVNGTKYEPPLTLPSMPSLATLEDEAVAELLTYVRRAWGHQASPVSPAQVKSVRANIPDVSEPMTEADLLAIP